MRAGHNRFLASLVWASRGSARERWRECSAGRGVSAVVRAPQIPDATLRRPAASLGVILNGGISDADARWSDRDRRAHRGRRVAGGRDEPAAGATGRSVAAIRAGRPAAAARGLGGVGHGRIIHRAVVRRRAPVGGRCRARHVSQRLRAALGLPGVRPDGRVPRAHDARAVVLRGVAQVRAGARRVLRGRPDAGDRGAPEAEGRR